MWVTSAEKLQALKSKGAECEQLKAELEQKLAARHKQQVFKQLYSYDTTILE